MKESREKIFERVVENIKDKKYKNWLLENKSIFITRPRTQKKAYLDALCNDSLKSGLEGIEIFKGDIWYANLDPKGSGKIRPVVIWQNNLLNKALTLGIYHSIIILPISSRLYDGIYRYRIETRDNLPKNSEVVCQAIGLISSNRIMTERGVLTKLLPHEINNITKILEHIMNDDFSDL